MNILIVGGGGREHALAWSLKKSPQVASLYVAPGNAGTVGIAENVAIAAHDLAGLLAFAQSHEIGLTVVGPEVPLAAGIIDLFTQAGLRAFGPTKAAAQIEASKAFSKQFMQDAGIPTAAYAAFSDLNAALDYLDVCAHPVVVKADGLAAGKGVVVCANEDEARASVENILRDAAFGAAGSTVIIEECMTGPELSVLAFCDGKTAALMPAARDHKRIYDGDRGLNTGGMGAYAPAPDADPALIRDVLKRVIEPTLAAMAARGIPYTGVLYAGLMLTPDGLRVLEFNARFGDPETQAILPLLESDLLDILLACVDGTLAECDIRWSGDSCATVVMAAEGYPASPRSGDGITFPEREPLDAVVFHAGTALRDGQVVTHGGRVLSVSARGVTLNSALDNAYRALGQIHFAGMHYRSDIGRAHRPLYARAGVDIEAGSRATTLMKEAVRSTYSSAVLSDTGSFGGLYDVSSLKSMASPVLVASTDGVGTKTMIAARMNRWDSIGQDLVNHCVNDILVQGAHPLFFLDYVASSKLRPEQIAEVVGGVAKACRAVGCALLGGETAEMPGVYQPGELDLAGTVVGIVEHDEVLTGARCQPGDVILAFPSTGLHTNGYSLARAALKDLDWEIPRDDLNGDSIGQALLAIHRPYLREVEALWDAGINIHAMAHITGGGLYDNLPRVLPDSVGALIERGTWPEPAIFRLVAQRGGVPPREQFHALNMGLGLLVIVPQAQAEKALALHPHDLCRVGHLTDGGGIQIEALYG
jgi:phosphoribosylamine--glycine ligase/phosphoribosylaminoimidazole synthetase